MFTKQFVPTAAILLMALGGIPTLSIPQMAAVAQSTPPSTPAAKPTVSFNNPIEAKILEQLNLTTEQKQRMQSIDNKYQSAMQQLLQSAIQLSGEYQQALNSDTATDAQIRDKYNQMQAASQQVGNIYFEHSLAARNVLTVEQRKQKAAIMNDAAKMQDIIRQLQAERKLPVAPSRRPVQPQR